MGYGLGVDLGTTYTAAAVRADGRVRIVRLGRRRPEIPSLVFVAVDGSVLIGEAAELHGATEPARLAREFKRRLGDPVSVMVAGAPNSAHSLMARVLQRVLHTVTSQQKASPAAVTVTHPANWGPYKRELFEQAVRLADLERVTLWTEPHAAAVHYAAGQRVQPGETVAVYDLGGGTFDAAVLRKTDTGFTVLGEPEGIEHLGGVDFDQAVFAHVMATLGDAAAGLDPDDDQVTASLARLRRDCIEAKEALSYDTEVMIPVALPDLHTGVRLDRVEFENMIAPAVTDTVAALRRALRSAGVTAADLTAILLAGGSSRIPLVAQLLAAEIGRPVVLDPDPIHCIALGAAHLTAPAITPVPNPTMLGIANLVDPPIPLSRATKQPEAQAAADASDEEISPAVSALQPAEPAQNTITYTPVTTGPVADDPPPRPARRSRRLAVAAGVTAMLVVGAGAAALYVLNPAGTDAPAGGDPSGRPGSTSVAAGSAGVAGTPVPGSTYGLAAVSTGQVADVNGRSTALGAWIIQWPSTGATNQQWVAEAADAGRYRFRSVHSGLCIDVEGTSTADNARVVQWTCHTGLNQQWTIRPAAAGGFSLIAAHSGKVLTVSGTAQGAALVQRTDTGAGNQRWRLARP